MQILLAEEEGFYFAQYEGGIRWHTLVRYTESAANKQFTFCPRKHWLPSSSNSVSFCSTRIAAWESTTPSRIKIIFRVRPGPGCPTKNPCKTFTSCLSSSSLEEIGSRLSHALFQRPPRRSIGSGTRHFFLRLELLALVGSLRSGY